MLPARYYYLIAFLFFSFIGFCQDNVPQQQVSKLALQDYIVKAINQHGFEEDTFDRKYKASFEGDHLRLVLLQKNGKLTNSGQLYDFANVYKFQKVSSRTDKLAFINIYVATAQNDEKTLWDKHKLTLRIDSATDAGLIVNALKAYNGILVKEGN